MSNPPFPPDTSSLLFAYELDGMGGAKKLSLEQATKDWDTKETLLWTHFNILNEATSQWVSTHSKINPIFAEILLAEQSRPCIQEKEEGILLILKGVNYEQGAEPEDLVSLRMWITKKRIISFRVKKSRAVEDLTQLLHAGKGIKTAGDFLVELLDHLVLRMHDLMEDLEEELDTLEEMSLSGTSLDMRSRLGALRQQTVGLRKHLHPQRDVMASLPHLKIDWINDSQKLELLAITQKQTRYVEELDFIRERSLILQEQLNGITSESLVRKMYLLAIITFIFDPLDLIVGLWGTNVGGIPWGGNAGGFWGVTSLLLFVSVLILYMLKKIRWF